MEEPEPEPEPFFFVSPCPSSLGLLSYSSRSASAAWADTRLKYLPGNALWNNLNWDVKDRRGVGFERREEGSDGTDAASARVGSRPGPVQTGIGLSINVAQGDCWSPWGPKANSSHVHRRTGKTVQGQVLLPMSPSGQAPLWQDLRLLFILTHTLIRHGTNIDAKSPQI